MQTIINKVNIILGIFVTFLSYIFGEFWYLFFLFLVFNVIDYVTGTIKSRIFKKENSQKGLAGILKKVGYWIVIFIAFSISYIFIDFGKIINIDLNFVSLFGWFTLATFTINEIRSIFENLIEIGVKVPNFLIKGLEISEKLLKDKNEKAERKK